MLDRRVFETVMKLFGFGYKPCNEKTYSKDEDQGQYDEKNVADKGTAAQWLRWRSCSRHQVHVILAKGFGVKHWLICMFIYTEWILVMQETWKTRWILMFFASLVDK